MRIGIGAGEASGDYLGAELIKALSVHDSNLTIEGIGGQRLQAQGCHSLFPIEKLSVMGLVEVLGNIFELIKIRNQLSTHFIKNPPDVFIGIDAPDFNLELEKKLRANGIKTVHYVSPKVWAWRQNRVKKIAAAVDLILTLFPFEKDFYTSFNIRSRYVGHPLADQIKLHPDKIEARNRLGLPHDKKLLAIMPGSRKSEMDRLLEPMLITAKRCLESNVEMQIVSSVLSTSARDAFMSIQNQEGFEQLPLTLFENRTHDVLEAADVVLMAAGTITLEAMLFKRPMVVTYRLNPITYILVKIMARANYVALPNILFNREIVPECLQSESTPERLTKEVLHWFNHPGKVKELENEFTSMHESMGKDASKNAANAIIELLIST